MGGWTESFFNLVITCLENIFTLFHHHHHRSCSLEFFFPSFHWSVRSWTGATRSRYGPSLLQRSEPFQVQESNTYPGTKETSQHGRTTGGNWSLSNIIDDCIKKAWRGLGLGGPYTSFFILCCIDISEENVCRAEGNRLDAFFGTEFIQEVQKNPPKKLQSDAQDWCQLHPDQSWSLPWELSGSISLREAVMVVVVTAPQAFILTCLLFPPSPLSAVRIKAQ